MNQRDYDKVNKDIICCSNIKRKYRNSVFQLSSTKDEDILVLIAGELSQYLNEDVASNIYYEINWNNISASVKLLSLLQDIELIDKIFTFIPKNVIVTGIEHVRERFIEIQLAILNSYNSDIVIKKSLKHLTNKGIYVNRLAVNVLLNKEIDDKWEDEVINIANEMLGEINKRSGFMNDSILYNLSLYSKMKVYSPIDLVISLLKEFNTDKSEDMLKKIENTGYNVEKIDLQLYQNKQSNISSEQDSIQSNAVENFIEGLEDYIPVKIESKKVIDNIINDITGYRGIEHKDKYMKALTYVKNTEYAIEIIIKELANSNKKATQILIEAIGALNDKRGIEAVKKHVNLKKYQKEGFIVLAKLNDIAMTDTYIKMYYSKKAKDRNLAVDCLCLMQNDIIRDFLLKIYGDQKIDFQNKILYSLGNYSDASSLNFIKNQISNKKLYPYALAALLKRGEDSAIDKIYDDITFLSNPIFCKESLVVYLTSDGNKKIIRILMQVLFSDSSNGTKAIATLHLNNLFVENPSQEFVEELKKCASDSSPLIRKASLILLGHLKHDSQTLSIYTNALDDQYYVADIAISRLTELLKTGQTLPDEINSKLIKKLSHPSMYIRLNAVNAVQYLGNSDSVEKLLMGVLDDRCDMVRHMANGVNKTIKEGRKHMSLKLTQTASGKYPKAAYGANTSEELDNGGIINREKINNHTESSLIQPIEKSIAMEILGAYLPDRVSIEKTTLLDMGIWKFAKALTESGSPAYEVFHLGINGNNQTNFVFLMQPVHAQNSCFIVAKCTDDEYVYAYMSLNDANYFALKLNQ